MRTMYDPMPGLKRAVKNFFANQVRKRTQKKIRNFREG